VLICDEDRAHTNALRGALEDLGWAVELTRSYAEAFALACAIDLEGIVCAPFLTDGSALALPGSLGIRRPPTVVLASRLGEHVPRSVARRVGFDAQLTKVVEPEKLDRLLRHGAHLLAAREERKAAREEREASSQRAPAPR
jgi:DNA-binding response OmpR family regulator